MMPFGARRCALPEYKLAILIVAGTGSKPVCRFSPTEAARDQTAASPWK